MVLAVLLCAGCRKSYLLEIENTSTAPVDISISTEDSRSLPVRLDSGNCATVNLSHLGSKEALTIHAGDKKAALGYFVNTVETRDRAVISALDITFFPEGRLKGCRNLPLQWLDEPAKR